MSRYVFEGKNFENCVVFSDERYGEIRMLVDDDGPKLYAGVDIAACMGYAAPGKVIMRCGIPGRIRMVPWVFKKKQGATDTRCFAASSLPLRIASGISMDLPRPTPTCPLPSPTTTKAVKRMLRPPFTTLVTRLMETTLSVNSRFVVSIIVLLI